MVLTSAQRYNYTLATPKQRKEQRPRPTSTEGLASKPAATFVHSLEFAPENGFGDRLKGLMDARQLSARELARLTVRVDAGRKGLSSTIILKYQKGVMPGLRELRILSQALDVSPLYLMLGSDQAQKHRVPLDKVIRESNSIFSIGAVRSPLSVGVVLEHLPSTERDALLALIEAVARRQVKSDTLHEIVRMGDEALAVAAQALGHAVDPQHVRFDFDPTYANELRAWLMDRIGGVVQGAT